MISFLLKVVVFTGLVSLLAWGGALVGPLSWRPSLADESAGLARAFQDKAMVDVLLRSASRSARSADGLVPPFTPVPARAQFTQAAAVVRIHALVLLEALPVLAALLSGALVLGLARREGLRSGPAFASPTRAYFGKHLGVIAVVYLASFAIAPLALPPESIWWGGGGAALGGYLYFANLPLKV